MFSAQSGNQVSGRRVQLDLVHKELQVYQGHVVGVLVRSWCVQSLRQEGCHKERLRIHRVRLGSNELLNFLIQEVTG